MKTSLFSPPAHDDSQDPIIKEQLRQFITAVSRSHAFQLERRSLFPKHIKFGDNSIGWKLNEILAWVHSRPTVKFNQGEADDGAA
ncbi:AlpA family transcriptional regulator [Shewanella electrodiphila]|uniref:AlpA family transcriptional regulator n=1 Tax=Shewanella electrodiphila TaxID=934143 RepID=A0ABT0KUL0_9GAMM|nr:AlpA family phage regulatory protein [Shewanella electrodiphila]MCL1047532.1 AlpA family transcriptional regulator [Shewanella electrodiphila]